ncbi:MAG: hypothetical protein ACRDZ4_02985 [Egibacteraceae bacterium]
MRKPVYRPKHAAPSDWVPAVGIGAGLLLAGTVAVALLTAGRAGGSAATAPSSPEPAAPPAAVQHGPPPDPREPTGAEAAEFAASYQPPGAVAKRTLAANANADGRREIVFASVAGGVVRMDVAAWDGRGYHIVGTGHGGPAAEIVGLQIRDITRDKVPEIIVTQRASPGTSVSIWGWDGATYAPQVARGGCADGRNTFGVNGAEVGVGTIVATCAASPRPPRDVYTWDRRAKVWVLQGR